MSSPRQPAPWPRRQGVIPRSVRIVNEAAAFILELLALGALAWWGFRTGGSTLASVALGIGIPVAAAVVWGLFAAPRATVKLPVAGIVIVKVVVFGGAALSLAAIDQPGLAIAFAALVAVNLLLETIDRVTGPTPTG